MILNTKNRGSKQKTNENNNKKINNVISKNVFKNKFTLQILAYPNMSVIDGWMN